MSDPVSKLSVSDPELMRFAANAADYGSLITDRWDLVVRAGKGLGHGAPACFIPSTAEIELDAAELGKHDAERLAKAGWSLSSIDLVRPTHRGLVPVMTGAFTHECSHSLHTHWPRALEGRLKDEPAQVVQLALALEEGRHETRMRRRDKRLEKCLSDTFTAIVLPGLSKIDDTNAFQLMHALALATYRNKWNTNAEYVRTYSYHYLSIACKKAGKGITNPSLFSDPPKAVMATDSDSTMLDLARSWWECLPEEAKDESKFGEGSTSCHSCEEDESSEGTGDFARAMRDFARAADKEMSKESAEAVSEATDGETEVGGTAASSKSSSKTTGLDGRGKGDDKGSGVIGYRAPTAEELRTAKRLARILQSAQTIAKVKAPKRLPPGRLRGKAAMEWTRDRSMGTVSNVSLFKGKTKGDTLPPIRIGIGLDVSGSMGGYCDMSASLGWTLAAASWDVNALVSAVCYGHGIMPYAEVGRAFKRVKTLDARAGEEAVGMAIEYLDSQVELLNSEGPRILVLISDGHYVNWTEHEKGAKLATQFVKNGGTILYIGRRVTDGSGYGAGWPKETNANVFTCDAKLDAVATTLGRLVRRAYERS